MLINMKIIMEKLPVLVSAKNLISLTPQESHLFNQLKHVVSATNSNTTLRVAGGWVRDKLLSKDSQDIDIALDNMMGEEFAKLVKENIPETSGVGTIKANPDASKHLETACLRVFGIEIDFVNLRAENYTEHSRIPEIKIGTPTEDAYRRDLTINSMFYNIHSEEIEDFTGYGIEDLRTCVARTPLSPFSTFMDDPLRVLRTIRFAARFDLRILEEVAAGASDPQVNEALTVKVSRERIGKEFTLMMKGKNPTGALRLFQELNVLRSVFALPENAPDLLDRGFQVAMNCKARQLGYENYLMYTAAVLAPYRDTFTTWKKKKIGVFEYVCMESLKTSVGDSKIINAFINNAGRAAEGLRHGDLKSIAYTIRNVGEYWESAFEIALNVFEIDRTALDNLNHIVSSMNLAQFYAEKPILNVSFIQGNEVRNLFACQGSNIAKVLNWCIDWQIENRDSTKEQVIQVLQERINEIIS